MFPLFITNSLYTNLNNCWLSQVQQPSSHFPLARANDANFKSILRNPGQKRLRGNLPAVMQPVFQPCNHVDGNNENVEHDKNVENVQRIKML